MKHQQHIVAFEKHAFGVVAGGPFVKMSLEEFINAARRSFFMGRRLELEYDDRFGQALPYVVFYRRRADLDVEMFCYRRTQKVGESRLAGNFSLGFGGHVDLADVDFDMNSVVNVVSTLAGALRREIDEEVIGWKKGKEMTPYDFMGSVKTPKFVGVINDTSNDVGRVHYGLVFSVEVPPDIELSCREEELQTVGWYSEGNVDISPSGEFENWSNIVLDNRGSL